MSKDHGYTITRCLSGHSAATALATGSGSRRMYERQVKYWLEQLAHARKRCREYDNPAEQRAYDTAYERAIADQPEQLDPEQLNDEPYVNASSAGYWDGSKP